MDKQSNPDRKNRIRMYVFTVSFLVMLIVLMVVLVEKPFEQQGNKEIVGALSDCFVVPGALIGGIGGLTLMGRLGAYDGLAYAFKNFGIHTLIGGNPKQKKAQSYYEYKKEKDENGRRWLPSFLYVGLVSLAVGVLLSIIYVVM